MAPASAPRPGRPLAAVLVLTIVLLGLMVGTGSTSPKLGLDLQGGTSLTLKPRPLLNGAKVSQSALNQAVGVIRRRVDALGVGEATVTTEGQDIVVSVPGKGRDDVLNVVGSTAELRFRQVVRDAPAVTAPSPTGSPSGAPATSPGAKPAVTPAAKPGGTPASPAPAATRKRVLSSALLAATPAPRPSAPAQPATRSAAQPAASPAAGSVPAPGATGAPNQLDLARRFPTVDCSTAEARRAASQPDDPRGAMIACSEDGLTKYILDKAAVLGSDISGAEANPDPSGAWKVDLTFKSKGRDEWGKLTQDAFDQKGTPRNQVAIVLDGQVVSAPAIQEPILGGQAQITGGFDQKRATQLADVLKFGALPLAFDRQQAVSVSATLGRDQLHAGLLAGAIGLVAVVLFSLAYYRGLGLVTIASLALAGVITYAIVSLLGPAIGFTLSLAGVTGLIVAIGITADSFVIYFERLRDEVREGRSLRSAAERGWQRARRTILVADGVSLLAAAVLYILAIGSVRGFAFTLGLSTILDVALVFLFTYPLITLLVRRPAFASGRPWTGLSGERLGSRPADAAPSGEAAGPSGRPVRPHRLAREER